LKSVSFIGIGINLRILDLGIALLQEEVAVQQEPAMSLQKGGIFFHPEIDLNIKSGLPEESEEGQGPEKAGIPGPKAAKKKEVRILPGKAGPFQILFVKGSPQPGGAVQRFEERRQFHTDNEDPEGSDA
jgi:hypothetical protein